MNLHTLYKYVTGVVRLRGATDNTQIGNVADRLKVIQPPFKSVDTVPFFEFLKNGANESLVINGATTPQLYSYAPTTANDVWYLYGLSIFIQDNGTPDPDEFGSLGSALTNGLLIQARSKGAVYDISNCKTNMCLGLAFTEHQMIPPAGWYNNSDSFTGEMLFKEPIKLQQSTGDYVRATVRDNLKNLDNFRIKAKCYKVIP